MKFNRDEPLWYSGPNFKHGVYHYFKKEEESTWPRHKIWNYSDTLLGYASYIVDECHIRRLTIAEKVLYGRSRITSI